MFIIEGNKVDLFFIRGSGGWDMTQVEMILDPDIDNPYIYNISYKTSSKKMRQKIIFYKVKPWNVFASKRNV